VPQTGKKDNNTHHWHPSELKINAFSQLLASRGKLNKSRTSMVPQQSFTMEEATRERERDIKRYR
jgi:hypothetical protein